MKKRRSFAARFGRDSYNITASRRGAYTVSIYRKDFSFVSTEIPTWDAAVVILNAWWPDYQRASLVEALGG